MTDDLRTRIIAALAQADQESEWHAARAGGTGGVR